MSIFAGLTVGLSSGERRRTAARTLLYSAVILCAFIVIGQLVLAGMGIDLRSLQIAGGIILFVFGLQMIFGSDSTFAPEPGHDIAVFPLAVPSIANPGSIMAVVVLTDNDVHSLSVQFGTDVVLAAILGVTYILMLLAGPVVKVIGKNGASIVVRVMGMILAALSVQLVLEALGVRGLGARITVVRLYLRKRSIPTGGCLSCASGSSAPGRLGALADVGDVPGFDIDDLEDEHLALPHRQHDLATVRRPLGKRVAEEQALG